MRIRHDESGQVLVLAALCLTALLGFVALATDVGLLFRAKRNLQIAADAAASAGALDYLYNASNSTAQTAANAAAARNGETNGSGGAVVTVNIPPQNGYHTTTGYVEVIITQASPTFFMNIFNINSVTVAARAVAGTPSPSSDCVYIMNPSSADVFTANGNYSVNTESLNPSGCNIYVNSSNPSAMSQNGNSGEIVAPMISMVGNYSGGIKTSGSVVGGAAPESMPFLNVTGPNPSSLTCNPPPGATEKKGVYSGTLTGTITPPGGVACYTGNVTITNAVLNAGIYVFTGGGNLTIGDSVTGTGVTLDNYSDTLSVSSTTTINISAPTSGAYNAIAILQPASNTNPINLQWGSATGTIDGFIVAPGATLTMQDHGGSATVAGLIVDKIAMGPAVLDVNSYNAAHPTTTPLKAVSLVE